MTLLSKKLAEIRAHFSESHRDEHAMIVELDRRLASQDAHLADELRAVIEHHDQRRAGLHQLLQALAGRAGLLPAIPSGASDAHTHPREAIDAAIDASDGEPMPKFLSSRGASDAIPPEAGLRPDASQGLGASAPGASVARTH